MDQNISTPQYFSQYRLNIGFSSQQKTKQYLSAKDIKPAIDYRYIEILNNRLTEIIKKINNVLEFSIKKDEMVVFIEQCITQPYEMIKENDLVSKLNNQGRRPEQVLFSWLRGYVIVQLFLPTIAKLFDIDIKNIAQIDDDDFSSKETFKRTAKADLSFLKNNQEINLEIQSGFLGVNDIKEHKVREAQRTFEDKKILTVCLHIDVFNGQVAFIRLDKINNNDINWVTRQQMEGQSVFNIEQNLFKWQLLDKLPKLKELGLGL